jgi:Transposase and inactivated derivatives
LDILLMKRKGLTQREIARKLGISRNTVKKYIEHQGYPEPDRSKINRKSLLDQFQGNIAAWLDEDMEYKATWIYDRLRPMGFPGSYEIVKRAVHAIKEERQRIAYMRFETEPGFQSQVDFGEFQVENADGTIRKLYLFSMILGYSRRIYSEFVDRCDLPTFLDCHIHAFDYFGGVPDEILYDRMKKHIHRQDSG